jgi:release factor glutamine methyltransferase
VTVLEGIRKSADFLAKKEIESPRLHAELLLAHVLRLPRMKLYLDFARALSPAETDALRELVVRRARREPLQHITGATSFCGLEIAVNRSVLVPRPETELLAEAGWSFLSTLNSQPSTALDFGTGSGCIAIALAAKCPGAKIVALDVSAEALDVARRNASQNQVAERIEFLHGDGFAALQNVGQASCLSPTATAVSSGSENGETGWKPVPLFDLIASNPPYIPSAEIAALEPEVRDFDPRGALDGGADGLDFYRRLAGEAQAFLKLGGRIMLEFGDGQAAAVREIFENQKWVVESVKADYSQRARILIAGKPSANGLQPSAANAAES